MSSALPTPPTTSDADHHRLEWGGRPERGWLAVSFLIVLLVVLPVLALLMVAAGGSGDIWPHLVRYVMPRALTDTVILLAGVAVLVVVLGAGLAWLTAAYDFPGRRALGWTLLLPLAMPTYIVAYAYSDLLSSAGSLISTLRGLGVPSAVLTVLDVRSLHGCILLFGLVLYPYVFLAARAVYAMQAANVIEVARTLGAGPTELLFRVALPLARPAIAVGTSLALLEALNDIGAAEFLGVETLTRAIYTTWTNRSSLAGAAQIALALLALVLVLVAIERWGRARRSFATTTQGRDIAPEKLAGGRALAAALAAWTPVLLGFAIPAGYLLVLALRQSGPSDTGLFGEMARSLLVASMTAAAAIACGLAVAYARRLSPARFGRFVVPLACLGYAMPGTVIALGLVFVASQLDTALAALGGVFGITIRQVLMGSVLVLCYACTVRFLAITAGGIDAGFAKIPRSIDDAASTLGLASRATLRRVLLPLLRPAIVSSGLLVFVDSIKELPATLMLRPLNFETLATHVYGEAARGAYEDGAIAALCIVLVGLLPVFVLARTQVQRPIL